MGWLGHVVRFSEEKLPKQMTTSQMGEKRRRGVPREQLMNEVKMVRQMNMR